ncbi:glycosyltransferase family 4 protein [Methylocystis echinoides]|uniref:glycosyltransferase family 4 protein n=1 Tax=Methylocystis echinoides TaxID=29468 RepID=UPI0034186099
MLEWYVTSIFYQPQKWPYRIEAYAPGRLRDLLHRDFKRFYHPDLDAALVQTSGIYEWAFRVARRFGFAESAKKLNKVSNKYLAKRVASILNAEPIDVLWGYDGCCLEAFAQAKKQNVQTVLDKTIGDPRVFNKIIAEVYEEFPEFFETRKFRLPMSTIDRQDHEYDLADRILAGSEFCRESIVTARPELEAKLQVVPYCFDDVFFPQTTRSSQTPSVARPVRFIFVGQAGPRKGIHLILRAFEKIEKSAAHLTILGSLQVPREVFAPFADRVEIVPTVRRDEVSCFLEHGDCLLFPSYFEGSAISIYEALASGLGIIQSKNTGVVIDSSVGWTLQQLNVEELLSAIRTIIDSPELLASWKANARGFAERLSFANYAEKVQRIAIDLADRQTHDI